MPLSNVQPMAPDLRPPHQYRTLAGFVLAMVAPVLGVGLLPLASAPRHPAPAPLPPRDAPGRDRGAADTITTLPPQVAPAPGLSWNVRPFAFPSELAGHPAPRVRIYVVPLAGVEQGTVELVSSALAFLSGAAEVTVLPRRPLPAESWNPLRAMYDAERLLTDLGTWRPRDGFRIVGVTDADLYATDLRFLFGLASPRRDAAVVSTVRLDEELWDRPGDWDLFRWRVLKIVAHELGHTLGLAHCPTGDGCLMSAIRSLQDADDVVPYFCERCRARARGALEAAPETSGGAFRVF